MLSQLKFLDSRVLKTMLVVVPIFCLVSLASIWALSRPKQASSWVRANSVAPESLVRNALALKNQLPLAENQLKAMKVLSQGAGNLYIIDFNTPKLCGAGGCLYNVYTEKGRLVLSLLLKQQLPKQPLFSVSEQTRNGFSCLVVTQPTGHSAAVSRSRYCYEGTGFTLVNSFTEGGV